MPSTPERWRQRGYNPTLELARHWTARAAAAGLPVRLTPEALTRPYRALPQASLARAQRLRNPVNAFVVPDAMRSTLPAKRVVVLDDVMTTGSTLREATLALKNAGCPEVAVWAVARVPPPTGDDAVAIDHPGTDLTN